jgi:hypothetical protein
MKSTMLGLAMVLGAVMVVGSDSARSQIGVGIRIGPPAPRAEIIVAAPFPHAMWVRGHWMWDPWRGGYVWQMGSWVGRRTDDFRVDRTWARGPRGWEWREGYWNRRDHDRRDGATWGGHERRRGHEGNGYEAGRDRDRRREGGNR